MTYALRGTLVLNIVLNVFSAGLSVKVVVTVHGALDRASEAIPV